MLFLEWEMFQIEAVEIINTYFVISNPPPPDLRNRAVDEIMWTNMVQSDRPQMTI